MAASRALSGMSGSAARAGDQGQRTEDRRSTTPTVNWILIAFCPLSPALCPSVILVYRYSYPMWNVTRPSGRRRMFVMWTGTPPGLAGLLDGVVNGVNAVFDFDGYGTDPRNRFGPSGPPIPCDSSSTGLPFTTPPADS